MFKLLRYFSIWSAFAVTVAVGVLATLNHESARADLVKHGERNNVAMARLFANSLWPRFVAHVKATVEMDPEILNGHTETQKIHESLKNLMEGTPVLKVKIYNLKGITVYSSEPGQIGEDKSDNPGFISAARRGEPSSQLSYRDRFSAYSGEILGLDMVESYIPVRAGDGPVEAVLEIYTDVTPLTDQILRTTVKLVVSLVVLFGILYAILYLIVRHADRILKRQYVDLQGSEDAMKAQNMKLEQEVAERARAEDETRQAKDQIEEASQAKSLFLAQMSHELRTPLNAIIGFSEMMRAGVFGPLGDPHYHEYADDIHDSGEHLLSLIDDVLDISKVEAGKLELHFGEFDVATAIGSCMEIVESQAALGKLEISTQVAGDLPRLLADERLVKQMLLNLLSNAIKFTLEGGRVVAAAEMDGEGCLALSVRDTGVGIAGENIPKIMTPFGQVDDSLTRKHKGTGLGIPLVKEMIELHGGSFKIDSEVGEGTTVTLRFPAERSIGGGPTDPGLPAASNPG